MKKTNQCNNLLRTKQLVLRISNMLKIFQPKLDKLLDTKNFLKQIEIFLSLCPGNSSTSPRFLFLICLHSEKGHSQQRPHTVPRGSV